MIRINRGDITIECETASDVEQVMTYLNGLDGLDQPYLGPMDAIPYWRVGGPPDKRVVEVVPNEVCSIEPHYIPVRAKCLEVLEAVMLFPDGVPCSGLETLLGLGEKQVSGRVQMLKRAGLVEMVPGHRLWRATTLARRGKLVAS